MKKTLSIFLFVLLLIPCVVVFAGAADSVDYGESVSFEFSIPEKENVLAGGITFSYDTDALELSSGEWYFETDPFISDVKLSDNNGVFAYGSPEIVGNKIFSATFLVKEGAPYGDYEINANIKIIYDDYDANDEAIYEIITLTETVTVACDHGNTIDVPRQAPTCQEVGFEAGKYCNDCETYLEGNEEIPVVSCDFSSLVAEAKYFAEAKNCVRGDLYFKSCSMCGKAGTETFEHGEPLPHQYTNEVVSPDYLKSAADCLNPAEYYNSCVCGKAGDTTFKNGDALGHDFVNYVSNNDATYTTDGTKTAACSRCDATDTVKDEGSALGLAEKFKDEVAALSSEAALETTYAELALAMKTYSELSDEEKALVAAEYETLQNAIKAYNSASSAVNQETTNAVKLAFAPLTSLGFVFLSALWALLKSKFMH